MHGRPQIDVVVIGAGVIGLCCALFLQQLGAAVTIVDDGTPEKRASFGHAGVFGVPYCLPAASPAALRSLPYMIRDPNHPFVLRARAVPRLIPWFLQFALSSRAAPVMRNIAAAAAIQRRAREDWDDVLKIAGAHHLVRWSGMLEVCETEATLTGMRAGWQVMRDHGFQVQELSASAVRATEPAVAPEIVGGAFLADAGHTVDPKQLTDALEARFIENGGGIIQDCVRSISAESNRCRLVGTRGGYSAHHVVIAAGVASAQLARAFGNRVALAAERGYHIMFADPSIELRRPVTLVDRKVVMSSMTTGLRMTSMAEFTTQGAPMDHERAARIFRPALPLLPLLQKEVSSKWVGSRPSTPDSLPVIGQSPGHRSIFFAFGHGGRGLTVAATTGRIIAALVAGQEPPIDIHSFRAVRF